jgi:hypothetical protein
MAVRCNFLDNVIDILMETIKQLYKESRTLRKRAPLLASQEENEWPRKDHTNPFAQPERTGIVRVQQKSQDQPGAKVRRNTAPDRRAHAVPLPPPPPAEKASTRHPLG